MQTLDANDDPIATVGEYFYDGDGKRVKKYVPDTGEVTVFVYDAGGKLIGEYSTVVQTGSDAKTVYTTNDHLGSPRINTDATGQVISRHDYHPFGEEIARTGYGSDSIRKRFTEYERDIETGLDLATLRYFESRTGRFRSPDPYNIVFEKNDGRTQDEQKSILINYTAQPQNWNKYVYVLNNPLILIDPLGELWMMVGTDKVQWVDKCPEKTTCYEVLVFNGELQNGTGWIRIFGSRNQNDITDYYSNANGQIDLNQLAAHHDAKFIIAQGQNIPEEFLSARAAATLFLVAHIYSRGRPQDLLLVFTAGNLQTGKGCVYNSGKPCHASHDGGNANRYSIHRQCRKGCPNIYPGRPGANERPDHALCKLWLQCGLHRRSIKVRAKFYFEKNRGWPSRSYSLRRQSEVDGAKCKK